MNAKDIREQLLRDLDIQPESDDEEDVLEDFDFDAERDTRTEQIQYSETVLVQDEWDAAKGQEIGLRYDFASYPAIADFHSMLFHLNPTPAGLCVNKRRQEFMDTMMDSPEYIQLRQSTRQNLLASELATVEVAKQFTELLRKDTVQNKADLVVGSQAKGPESDQPDGNCLIAVGQALKAAQAEVEAVEETQMALGQIDGLGQGEAKQNADLDQIRATYQRLRQSQRLRDIFDRAGAYRRAARSLQNKKSKHGYDDMVGVEMAGDVGRLLTNELAILDDEDLELDVLRRIVENQAACRQYEGVEPQNKGPVVVVVDESGSMRGQKIANAKALALAMAWIAKHQKRWCTLIGFSGGKEGCMLTLKPGKWEVGLLLGWLEHFFGGGTTLDVPLVELPRNWESMGAPKGKTDIIMITDAIVHAPNKMIEDFNKWKKQEQVKVITIVLDSAPGDLEKVSNEIHCVSTLSVSSEAAESCMSI